MGRKTVHTLGGINGYDSIDIALAPDGKIFGTAESGGDRQCGLVFKLVRSGDPCDETVVYSFAGNTDGCAPTGIYLDKTSGALYVTTAGGGPSNAGTVVKFVKAGGTWTENILYSFGRLPDGGLPLDRVIEDPHTGSLYGTTNLGGIHGRRGDGTVFEIRQ